MKKLFCVFSFCLLLLPSISRAENGTIWGWGPRGYSQYYYQTLPSFPIYNSFPSYTTPAPQYNYDIATPLIRGLIEGDRLRREREFQELEAERIRQETELIRAQRENSSRSYKMTDEEARAIEWENFKRKIMSTPYAPPPPPSEIRPHSDNENGLTGFDILDKNTNTFVYVPLTETEKRDYERCQDRQFPEHKSLRGLSNAEKIKIYQKYAERLTAGTESSCYGLMQDKKLSEFKFQNQAQGGTFYDPATVKFDEDK